MRDAYETLDAARLQQAGQYDKGRRKLKLKVGDLFLRRSLFLSGIDTRIRSFLGSQAEGASSDVCKVISTVLHVSTLRDG